MAAICQPLVESSLDAVGADTGVVGVAGVAAGVPVGRDRAGQVALRVARDGLLVRRGAGLVLLVLQVVLRVAVHDAATGDDGGRVLGRLSECRGGNDCNGECAQDGDDAAGHVTS